MPFGQMTVISTILAHGRLKMFLAINLLEEQASTYHPDSILEGDFPDCQRLEKFRYFSILTLDVSKIMDTNRKKAYIGPP